MVSHTQTNRRQQPTNCLSKVHCFEGLVLEGLNGLAFSWIMLKIDTLLNCCGVNNVRFLKYVSSFCTKESRYLEETWKIFLCNYIFSSMTFVDKKYDCVKRNFVTFHF